jgi:drug/metabolite transporter (DMT)-like permease
MPRPRTPVIALLVGACCIGLAPIFPKLAFDFERASGLSHGRPLGMIATAFWRMALAAPLLWVLDARASASTAKTSARDRGWLLLPGLFFAADLATWHKSFEYTALANSTLLANFATIAVSLAGWVWLKERLGAGFGLGVGMALCGAALLLGVDFSRGTDPILGDSLALLTACFYAAYLLLLKRLRARLSTRKIMAWSTTVSAILLLLIAALAGEGLMPHSARTWLLLVVLALVSQVGGQGLITYAMAHLPASFTTVTLLAQPVVTAVVSFFVFGQALSPLQLGGGVLVLAGIFLAQRSSAGSGRAVLVTLVAVGMLGCFFGPPTPARAT